MSLPEELVHRCHASPLPPLSSSQAIDETRWKDDIEDPVSAAYELPGCGAAPLRAPSQAWLDGSPPAVNMGKKPRM